MKCLRALVCLAVVMSLLSGCTGATQGVSKLTIVQGIGIDKRDDKTAVTIQYLDLAKSAGSTDSLEGEITRIITGESYCLSNAVTSASKSISQDIFLGQNKIIVFGGEYAKSGIDDVLDYILRSVDSRPDVLVAMCEDKARDIISNPAKNSHIPAEAVYNLMLTGEKNGISMAVSVNELLNMYCDSTTDIFIPLLKAEKKNVLCDGIAVFSENCYVGRLNDNGLLGFLLLNSDVNNAGVVINDKELGRVAVRIEKSKTRSRAIVIDNSVTFCPNIELNLTLDEVERGVTSSLGAAEIKKIERLVTAEIKKMCLFALRYCLDRGSDPFCISRYTAKCDRKYYDSVKSEWRSRLPYVNCNVKIKAKIDKFNDNSIR